jgi:DNA-binding GntR family transcriptional regulator
VTTPANSGGPVGHRTAQAAIVDLLRGEILRGEMTPGTRLLQNEIAERFETSTTPVREALRQLVAEGLLDGDAHRGVTVHDTSLEELEQIYEIRLVLEPLAIAATVENMTAEEMKAAQELVGEMESEDEPVKWIRLNAEFHRALAEAARRPRLATIVHGLRNISALYIAASLQEIPQRRAVANSEHRALIEAIAAGDVETAAAMERAHLEHTLELGTASLAGP